MKKRIADRSGFIVRSRSRFTFKKAVLAFVGINFISLQVLTPCALAAQDIVIDGRTATTLNTIGNVTDVRTSTVVNNNAFNSFKTFNVQQGNTVNLHLPGSTSNLINIVRDERTAIYGTLNSVKDGQIGGNVYFANPHGFVVGSSGMLNLGSLTVTTPTQSFVDNFFSAPGVPNQNSVDALFNGTAARSATGLISIQGKVSAVDGVNIQGRNVDVSGAIFSGAKFAGTAPDFSDIVNVNGVSSASNVILQNGKIILTADEDMNVSGTIAAPGATNVSGGDIKITAGKDVNLTAGANVSAQGNGENSSGGSIYIWGDNNSVFQKGAQINANAGVNGDGGKIELSARNLVSLQGGQFNAAGNNGKRGLVYIDPNDIEVISSNQILSGTDYFMEANKSIEVGGSVIISTRAIGNSTDYENAASTGDSGDLTLKAPTITLKSGSKLLAHATGNYQGGEVKLTAQKDHHPGIGDATAKTKIEVDRAKITGKNVTLEAFSDAGVDWQGDPDQIAVKAVTDPILGTIFFALTGINAAVAISEGKSEVIVKSGSSIEAQDKVKLHANADSNAESLKLGLDIITLNKLANVGFVYGQVDSTATVDVQSGATIKGANLEMLAANGARLDVNVIGISKDTSINAAVAVTKANVDATAQIASGATIDVSDSVSIRAINQNRFNTGATAMAIGTGQVGVAAAVFNETTKATATNAANLQNSTLQNVIIEAYDRTEKNKVSASGTAGTSFTGQLVMMPLLAAGEAATGWLTGLLSDGEQNVDDRNGPTSKPKLGAAVTYIDSSHTANAEILANTKVTAAQDVVVAAKVSDELVRAQVTSSVEGEVKNPTPENPSAKTAISAAIAVGLYENNANATIGDSAEVTAKHIGVHSEVYQPFEITWDKWEGVETITAKLSSNLGLASGAMTSFVNSTSEASETGLTGSVNYTHFTNNSNAKVGKSAKLKAKLVDNNPWSSLLSGGTVSWEAPIDIASRIDIDTVTVAGNLSLLLNGTGGGTGAKTFGGTYNQIKYDNTSRAFISEGATVESETGQPAVDVAVTSNIDTRIISVAPTAGRGGSYGLNAMFSLVQVNDKSQASVDDEAKVTARNLNVRAEENVLTWSLSGAFTMEDTAAVGLGIALSDITSDVIAFIGDNDANNDDGSTLTVTDGEIKAASVNVAARTDGRIESIGVTGAVVNSSKKDPANPGPIDKAKAWIDSTKQKMLSITNKMPFGPFPAPKETSPKFGLAISGSTAVNTVDLGTHAYINAPKITLNSSGNTSVNVSAVNDTDITAATGSAAIVRANNPSAKWSAGAAGSIAVNDIDNTTEAYIKNAAVKDAEDVSVTALSGGEQLAVAIGAAVNISADQKKAGEGAGSVSVSQVANKISARIENTTLTGRTTGSGREVNVIAYDRMYLGTGGGSLAWGGKGGVGAAITYAEISDITEAVISGTTITNYDDANVHALTATKMGSGGGVFAYTSTENSGTFGGSFVNSVINNKIHAEIKNSSSVTTSNKVDVLAADTTGISSLDTVIDSRDGGHANSVSLDYDGTTMGQSAGAGSSIISVAGVVQIGKNNVGISFANNEISNEFLASVSESTVSAGNTGTVNVLAESNASMYGIAVGVGKGEHFAGTGSVTLNKITNSVIAEVNSTSNEKITAGTLNVKAEDKSRIYSFAGSVSLSNETALSGAVAANEISNTARASANGIEIDAQNATQFQATNNSTIKALSLSMGVSVAQGKIENTTTAGLTNVKGDDTGNSIAVNAKDDSDIEDAAGGIAYAKEGDAIGAAIAVNEIKNNTESYVAGSDTSLGVKNLRVGAESDGSAKVLAIGVAVGGGGTGGAGSIAVNHINSDTTAKIDGGAQVTAENNVAVTAESNDSIQLAAGALGVGMKSWGVGGSVTVNAITGSTKAYISGSNTSVTAKGLSATDLLTVRDGTLTDVSLSDPTETSTIADYHALDLRSLKKNKTVRGLAVNASSSEYIEDIAVNVGVGKDLGLALNVNVNLIGGDNSQTAAYISGARINSGLAADTNPEAVDVNASNHAYSSGFSGSVGIGAAGAGIGFDGHTINRATRAYITDTAVKADGAVRVDANTSNGISSIAVGGALGTQKPAVALTGSLAKFNTTTEAYINNANIIANTLDVEADNINKSFLVSGTLAGSKSVGVTASIAVGLNENTTKAYITADEDKRTTLDVAGAVNVDAESNTRVNGYAVGAALAGKVGVAASGSVNVLTNNTEATVSRTDVGTATDKVGSMKVHAGDNVVVESAAGALGVGVTGVGIGAGASVNVLKSSVNSTIDGSKVYSAGNVEVTSNSKNKVEGYAIAVGGGKWVGIGGGAAVTIVGSNAEGDARSELDYGGDGTISTFSAYTEAGGMSLIDQMGVTNPNIISSDAKTRQEVNANAEFRSITFGTNPKNYKYQTSAQIIGASTVISAAGVTVTAEDKTSTYSLAGGVGLGIVGVGGAAAVANISSNVSAVIGEGVNTTTTGGITISASAQAADDGNTSKDNSTAQTLVFAGGGGGVVGIGAAYTEGKIKNNVTASVGGIVNAGGPINISAVDGTNIDIEAWGATVAGLALGATIARATKDTTVTAEVQGGSGVTVTGAGNDLTIDAKSEGRVKANATGGAIGSYAGLGVDTKAQDYSKVNARAGQSATLSIADVVSLNAKALPQTEATAIGVSIGLVGVGVSLAEAHAGTVVNASIGNNSTITANSLSVNAGTYVNNGVESAKSNAIAGSGGLVGVNATEAISKSDSEVTAEIGDNVTLPTGNVSVVSNSNSKQKTETTGINVGFIAAGANYATSIAEDKSYAKLGTGTITSANRTGNLTIHAMGTDDNTAKAIAGSGGVAAGNASTAAVKTNTRTAASIAGNDTRTTLKAGQFLIAAEHATNYGNNADSVNAAFVGGSGAFADSNLRATTSVDVGRKVTLDAPGVVTLVAKNIFNETEGGDNSNAGAGGLLNGTAAVSATAIHANASVNLADYVNINSGTNPLTGGIILGASSFLVASDKVTLVAGGLIQGAGTNSEIRATLDNAVNIGAHDELTSKGVISAGTFTRANATVSSNASTYGLAAVSTAHGGIDLSTHQSVSVGSQAVLDAFDNINLTPGEDPLGYYETVLNGNTSSEAYVQGLIAVPTVGATTRLQTYSTLEVGTGAQVKSAQNVTLGAYTGSQISVANGYGHGYVIGLIPVTDESHNNPSVVESKVIQNGTVTAGVYHDLEIEIDDCKNRSNLFCDVINQKSGAPVTIKEYQASFDPHTFIDGYFSGPSAELMKEGVSSTPVGAVKLSSLFASGGTVTVDAKTIQGSGTVTAWGGPTIKVINKSPDYLVLSDVFIPNTPGGRVNFTGSAGVTQARAAGLTINENNPNGMPTIDIHNSYKNTVGTSDYGPALFLTGPVENMGGLIKITNDTGSFGQAATIVGQQVQVSIPSGIAVVSVPAPYSYYAGGGPYSKWDSYMIWPGGNPASGNPNANEAIAYVANAEYNSNGAYTDSWTFTRNVVGQAGDMPPENHSNIYYGNCFAVVAGDCSAGNAARLSPLGQAYLLNPPAGSNDYYYAVIPVRSLRTTVQNYPVPPLQTGTSIYGAKVAITAKYIDIDGEIIAGVPTNWSLNLASSLKPTLQGYADQYNAGGVGPLFDIPGLTKTTATDSQISAQYNAETNQIIVNNVNASSGGGQVSLVGGIISTNPGSKIHINGGMGHVDIVNQTDIPVVIQNVNTGNTSLSQALSNKVEITDTLKSGLNHWLYEYRPGQGINVYQGAANEVLGGGTPIASIAGSSTQFTPEQGRRFQWVQRANLARTKTRVGSWWDISEWRFTSGTSNNPWQYVIPGSGQLTRTPVGQVVMGQAGGPAFEQTITGSSSKEWLAWGQYHGCSGGIGSRCNFGFARTGVDDKGDAAADWFYYYAMSASLTSTTSVKADNPFAIDFSGNARGYLSVSSNAAVSVAGNVLNPNGDTIINAGGSINESGSSSVISNNLTMTATGGIGSNSKAFDATLTGGVLNAQGSSDGVYLNINSGAIVQSVASGNAQAGYGDVLIQTTGDMSPVANQGNATNVVGRNITLNSSQGGVGSEANPLVISAKPTALANGGISGGVVNVGALNDIGLRFNGGDMLIDKIASEGNGNIFIEVPNGTILASDGHTAAQALDPTQTTKVWQNLRLTSQYGAQQAGNETVVAFQNNVRKDYEQYWNLRANGTAQNGTFTLNNDAVPLFRAMTAANLGVTSVTDQQVLDYTSQQYQKLIVAFDNNIGSGWSSSADFQTFNSGFSYTATTAQVTDLTKNSVWDEKQLTYAINRDALDPASGTVGIAGEPNIVGHNIKLITQGAIGKLADPVFVGATDLKAGNVNSTQASALALATTPGDVLPVGTNTQGQRVNFNFEIDSNGEMAIPAGITLTGFDINQTAPLFINALGSVNVDAGNVVYLQSTTQNLNIDHIQANGNVSLTAPQNIFNVGSSARQIETPGNLTLIAGGGSLGAQGAPIVYQIGGNLVSASAGQDAYLEATGGDMTVGKVFAGSTLSLSAPDGSITPYLNGVALQGQDIILDARDNIGSDSKVLRLTLGSNGQLDGNAGGSAYVYSPAAPLQISTFSADAGLNITGQSDLTAQNLVANSGVVNATAGGNLNVDTITSSDAITLQSGGATTISNRALSQTGTINIESVGDITIGNVETGNATTSAITITSITGHVLDGGDIYTNIVANNGTATIHAAGDIGQAANSLEISTASIDAASTNGGVYLNTQNDLTSTQITAGTDVVLQAGHDATLGTVEAGHDVTVIAGNNLSVNDVIAGNKATLDAGNILTIGHIKADNMELSANGDLSFTSLEVVSQLGLHANNISGSVLHTGVAPLLMDVTGPRGTIASNVDLVMNTQVGVTMNTLFTQNGSIRMTGGNLDINNGIVVSQLWLTNPYTDLLIDNQDRSLRPVDTQLYSANGRFDLSFWENAVMTNNAFVIQRGPFFRDRFPAGVDTSALEAIYAEMAKAAAAVLSIAEIFDSSSVTQQPYKLIDYPIQGVPVNVDLSKQAEKVSHQKISRARSACALTLADPMNCKVSMLQ